MEKTQDELEDEISALNEKLSQIEDLIDDADTNFHQAFEGGYEYLEQRMDWGFAKLNEAKSLL